MTKRQEILRYEGHGMTNKVLIKVVHAPVHPKDFICCLAYIDKADHKLSVTITTITNNSLNETGCDY